MEKTLNLVKNDPWLEPFAGAITGRHQHVLDKEAELTNKGKQTLSDFASGYLYFGLHRTDKGWTFREWAPNATHIYMVGTFNNWEEKAARNIHYRSTGLTAQICGRVRGAPLRQSRMPFIMAISTN